MAQENDQILERAELSNNLIMPVEGLVEKVIGHTTIIYGRTGRAVFGGPSGITKTGTGYQLEILLEEAPITKLVFNAYSPVLKGDRIRAYIFQGKEEDLGVLDANLKNKINDKRIHITPAREYEMKRKFVYVKRPFNETETAVAIELLRDGEVVRTDLDKELADKYKFTLE